MTPSTTRRRRREGDWDSIPSPEPPPPSGSSYVLQASGDRITLASGSGFLTRAEE